MYLLYYVYLTKFYTAYIDSYLKGFYPLPRPNSIMSSVFCQVLAVEETKDSFTILPDRL